MPRQFGILNAPPYASAPAVGLAGDMYYNTAQKILYLSDGTIWRGGGGSGIPSGGATGQALAKNTATDFDAGWQTFSGQLLSTYNGSMDSLVTPGIYVRTAVTGDPIAAGNSVIVEVLAGQDTPQQWRLQRMTGATTPTNGQVFQRTTSSGSGAWLPWIQIAPASLPSALIAAGVVAGPFSVAQTSFASAATWGAAGSGLQPTITPIANHYYRIRFIVPQVSGMATGNAVYLQIVKDGASFGQVFGYQAYLTGVLRGFAPPVEYVGSLGTPGTPTTFGIRGWSSVASTGAVACEGGQGVTCTIEDMGIIGGGAAPTAIIPGGGNTGQVLLKNSAADYDMIWGGDAAPLGLIGFSAGTDGANRTATGFASAVDQGTISGITIVAGRRYRIRVFWPGISASYSAGNGAVQAAISRSGSQHGDTVGGRSGVSGFGISPVIAEWTGSYTAGTYNFAWRIWCGASVTGVVTSGTIIMTVEDLGALV